MSRSFALLVAAVVILNVLVSCSGFAQITFCKPNWRRILFGPLILFAALCIYAVSIIAGTPGCVDANKEKTPIGRLGSPVDDLEKNWDSEAVANWPSSVHLATCCDLAYLSPPFAKRKMLELGFSYVETVAAGSMIGYVVGFDNSAVIVFRGTDDNFDWFVNLNSVTSQTEDGEIHAGFQASFIPLKPQIEEIIASKNIKTVWLTGHSLGGALAIICAYELRNVEIKGIVTYGQPMVADSVLASHLDLRFAGRYAHFVNNADIVPRVPPGLTHCGSLVWLVGDEIRRSRPLNRKRDLSSVAEGNVVDLISLSDEEFLAEKEKARARASVESSGVKPRGLSFRSDLIEDHSMQQYIKAIRSHFK